MNSNEQAEGSTTIAIDSESQEMRRDSIVEADVRRAMQADKKVVAREMQRYRKQARCRNRKRVDKGLKKRIDNAVRMSEQLKRAE